MKTILTACAAIALLTGPALANGPTAETATIRHADLDLSTPAGRRALDRRIADAKETVCGSYAGAAPYEADQISRCRADVARQIDTRLASRMTPRVATR